MVNDKCASLKGETTCSQIKLHTSQMLMLMIGETLKLRVRLSKQRMTQHTTLQLVLCRRSRRRLLVFVVNGAMISMVKQ